MTKRNHEQYLRHRRVTRLADRCQRVLAGEVAADDELCRACTVHLLLESPQTGDLAGLLVEALLVRLGLLELEHLQRLLEATGGALIQRRAASGVTEVQP